MIKNQSALILTVILGAFFGGGCKPTEKIPDIHIQPQCLPSQKPCEIVTEFGRFSVLFNLSPLVTETDFKIYLQQSPIQGKKLAKLQKVSAYLEGKNMYMGKIPLFFEVSAERTMEETMAETSSKALQSTIFSTNAILGSCSEKVMTWILWLDFEVLIDGQLKKQKMFIEFDSQRYGD